MRPAWMTRKQAEERAPRANAGSRRRSSTGSGAWLSKRSPAAGKAPWTRGAVHVREQAQRKKPTSDCANEDAVYCMRGPPAGVPAVPRRAVRRARPATAGRRDGGESERRRQGRAERRRARPVGVGARRRRDRAGGASRHAAAEPRRAPRARADSGAGEDETAHRAPAWRGSRPRSRPRRPGRRGAPRNTRRERLHEARHRERADERERRRGRGGPEHADAAVVPGERPEAPEGDQPFAHEAVQRRQARDRDARRPRKRPP